MKSKRASGRNDRKMAKAILSVVLLPVLALGVELDPLDMRWTFGAHEPITMYRRKGVRTTGGIEGGSKWVASWLDWFDTESPKLRRHRGRIRRRDVRQRLQPTLPLRTLPAQVPGASRKAAERRRALWLRRPALCADSAGYGAWRRRDQGHPRAGVAVLAARTDERHLREVPPRAEEGESERHPLVQQPGRAKPGRHAQGALLDKTYAELRYANLNKYYIALTHGF